MENPKYKYFIYKDNIFTYMEYEDFDESYLPKVKKHIYKNKYNRTKYVDIGCGFDIETTKIDETHSTMFVWQFGIGDLTILGRTWDQFNELLARLSKFYELDEKYKLLVFIHNMKYEWSFMKRQIQWNIREYEDKDTGNIIKKYDVFALDFRTIIKATTSNYIEFRDSYVLTLMSLGTMAEKYNLGISKLKGDFDYSLIRNSKTELTNQEKAYCINDAQILVHFYKYYIKRQFINKRLNIPLTSTGIVRDELKREFKKLPKKEKDKLKKYLKVCFPKYEDYMVMMDYLYRGGFTHANINRANAKFVGDIMGSYDFKSSYPAVMLHNLFVWHYREECPDWFYLYGFDKKVLEHTGYWGEFKIYDVKRKKGIPHTIESKDKLVDYSDDAKFDNGRLMSASWIVVYLTEQDVLNYLDIYDVEMPGQWTCLSLHIGKKEPLPNYLKDLVLKYFYLKETLEKDTIEYVISKSKLNAFYGMCCTAILFSDLVYNNKTGQMELSGNNKSYEKAIEKLILLPQWGIQISAYARRNLVKTFAKLGNDAIYGDTDSAKVLNLLNNEYIFKDYNDRMTRLNKTMYVGKYDRSIFSELGKFDYEGKILCMKTLGCKRYIFTEIKKDKETNKYKTDTVVKAAGIVKGTFQKYCDKNNLDYYDEFTFGLELDEEYSDKLTTNYNDNEEFSIELTDYQGNTTIQSEKSCCTLNETTASITYGENAKQYILLIAEAVKRYERTGTKCTVWR